MKNRRILLIILLLIALAGCLIYYFAQINPKQLPTYFSYEKSELDKIKTVSSSSHINQFELNKWDNFMFNFVRESKLGDAYAARVYAYTYLAQRDFAYLAYNIKGDFEGSIDYVSSKVLCHFFANKCAFLNAQTKLDPFSILVGNMVMAKINKRIVDDNKSIKPYLPKMGTQYWIGVKPFFADEVGSWKPWFLKSSAEFRVPPPPNATDSNFWNKELLKTEQALQRSTPEQKKYVIFWAGNPGTITPPGQWLILANEYMAKDNISLQKTLLVRSVLAMSIDDAVIAVFDSKYTYWIRRPNMLDKTIVTIMPTPNHPSYPAGHAVISYDAATILNHYFPENHDAWMKHAEIAANSRLWGGIHFPIDNTFGAELGRNVGNAVIKRQNKHEN